VFNANKRDLTDQDLIVDKGALEQSSPLEDVVTEIVDIGSESASCRSVKVFVPFA